MTILITGGTGFIGKHLITYLTNHYPHKQLILLARKTSAWQSIHAITHKVQIAYIEQGIDDLYHQDIEAIIHLATDYGKKDKNNQVNIQQINQSNVQLGLELLALAESKQIPFLYSDTFFILADKNYPYMREYIQSKRHFFEWLCYYAQQQRVCVHNLRLFHPFGEGDKPQKFFSTMIKKCLNHEAIDLTEGLQQRDFIYIHDAIQAFSCVLEHALNTHDKEKQKEKVWWNHYEVGYGTGTSVRQLVEWIKQFSHSTSQLNFGAIPMRKGEFEGDFANPEALINIGWIPQFSVETGIKQALAQSKQ